MDQIASEFLRAIGYLIISLVAYFAWKLALDASAYQPLKKVVWKSILWVVGLALFSNLYLGTHTEDCDDDPIYGSCDVVQDFEPSYEQRAAKFIYFVTLLGLPVTLGIYSGHRRKSYEAEKLDS